MLHSALRSVLVMVLLLSASLGAQTPLAPGINPAFEQLKSLAGTWEGRGSTNPTKVTYEVVSNGSVLMERVKATKEPEMITMYSLDSSRLLATHYCSMGNQPTMQTDPLSAGNGKYEFHFVRVTGTKSPDEAHMTGLTLHIIDKDHISQTWTFEDHGKSMSDTFTYTRK